jgi:SAM-dependent methyltransferase
MAGDPHLSTAAGCRRDPAGFNFRRAFARHWRDSVRAYGFSYTLKQLGQAFYALLMEILPWRRHASFGDLDYDWEHGVDTTRSNVSFRTQLAAALTAHPYFASEPWIFREMIERLPSNRGDLSFVDIGSGKGRALLLAAEHGFRRVIGLEFLPQLHRIAENNIARFAAASRGQAEIASLWVDARDFAFPLRGLVVYLYNPFPQDVFAVVLENLRRSFAAHPRPIWIAYRFPEFESLLEQSDWLEKVAGTGQWALYKAVAPSSRLTTGITGA